jgi:citrate lyase subunit beta / citryl-CoA lyase
MLSKRDKILRLVRRSKLFVPVNREKFIAKAWMREADCIILDLEDAIPPSEKTWARKRVKDIMPIVSRGGAEVQVRINRGLEEEDLEAVVFPGLVSIMIPKCESAEEIQKIDGIVAGLEKERGIPVGSIQFDLLIETAVGVVHMEPILNSSPRIVQSAIGGVDLARDMGYTPSRELSYDQFSWAAGKLLFSARAAGVQVSGLTPRGGAGLMNTSGDPKALLEVCHQSFMMGYLGTPAIHPLWCNPINEGFKSTPADLDAARRVKTTLQEAFRRGDGSVALDGRMVDVAHLEQVNQVLERAECVARREAEKAAAVAAGGLAPGVG